MTSSLIVINHKSVSFNGYWAMAICCLSQVSILTLSEVGLIENFECQFDHDLISQGHHKHVKWCTVTLSVIAINHRSAPLMVTKILPIEKFEGQFDLDLISQGHQIMHSDIICNCYQSQLYFQRLLRYGRMKFWQSIWPWPNLSRSSQIWQIMHNVVLSHCCPSQACISNSCWDMAD